MTKYLIRRVFSAIPLIFLLLTLTYFIIRLAPGDPASLYVDPAIDPAVADQIRERLGLNEPIHIQYFKWLASFFTGEFGVSFSLQRPVIDILRETIPNTLLLTSLALLLNLTVGILVGTFQAIRRGSRSDRVTTTVALFFYSMPGFWLALMLILVFSLWLGWLPASQMHDIDAEFYSGFGYLVDTAEHLVLPVFSLGIASAAGTARYMRGSLVEVIREDYIRTARAKGLSERVVIFKHAMRNALLPIISITGLSLPFLLSGSVVIETVFAWPGMGRVIVEAIFARDYPLIIANTMIAGVMVVAGNLIADVLYAVVDPRIKYRS